MFSTLNRRSKKVKRRGGKGKGKGEGKDERKGGRRGGKRGLPLQTPTPEVW